MDVSNFNLNEITFPIGYLDFHKQIVYNFQFNRWHSMGYAREEDFRNVAPKIKTFSDWKIWMVNIAEKAEREKRLLNAAFYYRAAEFYMSPGDPDKQGSYENFLRLFKVITAHEGIEEFEIPYGKGFLPCLKMKAREEKNKQVLVIHGGFDSFKEEFLSMLQYFSRHNFEVYVFDGPGQGNARRKYGLTFDYRWEKPVAAVLDFFTLDNVTLLGISLGGYLCLRAAAFEPRIKRVIANSVAYDHMQIPPLLLQPVVKLFYFKFRNFTNNASWSQINQGKRQSWYLSNLMYMTGVEQPIEGIDIVSQMTADKLHCNRITQDVLILTSRDDHLIPFKMHKKQIQALTNASSVTGKIFYKDTSAGNHCQVGNIGLALETMLEWIKQKGGCDG